MLSELFAKWLQDLPGFILVYLALFGVGRLGIHGFLSSFWKLAENVASARAEIKSDFSAVKESQAEIKISLARVEKKLEERPADDGALRLSIK
jgi:hypothetical protein